MSQGAMLLHRPACSQQPSWLTNSPAALVTLPCLVTAFRALMERCNRSTVIWERRAAPACFTMAAPTVQVVLRTASPVHFSSALALLCCVYVSCQHRSA